MPKAVRFEEYGGVDVLHVVDVPQPEPGPGQVLVQVKATSINPGEAKRIDTIANFGAAPEAPRRDTLRYENVSSIDIKRLRPKASRTGSDGLQA
jgi:NADPH:quinone reductase-like Zn-dependent oxidoreductase